MADTTPQPSRDWRSSHLWQIQPIRDGVLLAAVVGLVWLGYRLSVVTVPMLLALALAYLCEPIVRKLTSTKLFTRPGVAVGMIFGVVLVVILPVSLGLGFAAVQGARFAQSIAKNVDQTIRSINNPTNDGMRAQLLKGGRKNAWLSIRDYIVEQEDRRKKDNERKRTEGPPVDPAGESGVPTPAPAGESPTPPKEPAQTGAEGATVQLQAQEPPAEAEEHSIGMGLEAHGVPAPSEIYQVGLWGLNWVSRNAAAIGKQVLNVGGGAFDAAWGAFSSLFGVVFGGFLTAFFFFFFCTGYGKVLVFWEGLIPERRKGRVIDLLGQMDAVIAGFVRGRLTICAILISYYILAYWAIGVPAPLVVGLVVGSLTLVPYAAGAAVPLVMLLMWLGGSAEEGWHAQWWWIVGSPLIALSVQQVLDDYVLTPRVQGKSTNMDTPTILFASIAGGAIAGFYGLLLAIPVAACIKILVRELVWPRVRQWLAGKAADPLPIERE